MAQHLDLEEQEQLDQLKHFWQRYGNFISWMLIAVLGVLVAYNAYQYWQRRQATQAAILYDTLEQTIKAADMPRLRQVWGDMQARVAHATITAQAGLLAAKTFYDKGNPQEAQTALAWVSEHATDEGLQALARLRLAGLLLETKNYDLALAQLQKPLPKNFEPLAQDRRADILFAQGKTQEAKSAYELAYKGLQEGAPYRRLIQAKRDALGGSTEALAAKEKP